MNDYTCLIGARIRNVVFLAFLEQFYLYLFLQFPMTSVISDNLDQAVETYWIHNFNAVTIFSTNFCYYSTTTDRQEGEDGNLKTRFSLSMILNPLYRLYSRRGRPGAYCM